MKILRLHFESFNSVMIFSVMYDHGLFYVQRLPNQGLHSPREMKLQKVFLLYVSD